LVQAAAESGATLAPEYLWLLTALPIMVLFHCPGMCGPLMLSFRFGLDRETRRARIWGATSELLAYQAGRALLYAIFGALAGLLGAAVAGQVKSINKVMILVIAVVFLLMGLRRFGAFRFLQRRAEGPPRPGLAGRLTGWLRQHGPQGRLPFACCLGAALAFMPCGLTFMAIGMAAARSSVLEGMLILVALVLITTPVLLGIVVLPAAVQRWKVRAGGYVEAGLMCFGGLWIGLHGLAMNGVFAPLMWQLTVWGTEVKIMLF
jgi:sulfite exporter TauE/SafE